MTFQVSGLNKLMVELGAEATHAPHQARKVVQEHAAKVKATAQQLVPQDTGELQRSISYETRVSKGGAFGEVGPTARHGIFVEWGTSKMAPRAFMGPALDRHSDDFVDGIAEVPGL